MRTSVLMIVVVAVAALLLPVKAEVTSEDDAVALGRTVTQSLVGSLISRLTLALEEGDTGGAMKSCSDAAINATDQISEDFPEVVELKRVTEKPRNPENKLTTGEVPILESFTSETASGMPLQDRVIQTSEDGVDYYVYYKPMYVMPICTQCHGDPDTFTPEVKRILTERYPDDLATGYEAGDFRGLIKVRMLADTGRPGQR